MLTGAHRSLFYTGDSGYFAGYAHIGARYGPFDATLMQVGEYDVGWPDVHMTPEEAVAAHLDLRGGLLIPVHWGTFVLAFHPWAEPVDRLWREAKARELVTSWSDLAWERTDRRAGRSNWSGWAALVIQTRRGASDSRTFRRRAA